jgi:hypothetical protein
MLHTLRRAYSSTHSRDITAFFNKRTVKYSIPMYGEDERALFGDVLDVEFELSSVASKKFVLKKVERPSLGSSSSFKSYLMPEVKLLD